MPVRPAVVAAVRAAPRPRSVAVLSRRSSTRTLPPCCRAYSAASAPSIASSAAAHVPPPPPLDPPAAAPVVPVTAPATTATTTSAPPSLPPLPFASQGTRLFSLAGPEPNILPKSIQAALVPPRTCGTVRSSGAAHTSANAPLVPPRRPLSMNSLRTAHADLLFAAADVVIRQARAAQLVARLAHVLPHATAAPADPDVLAALAKCAQVLAQSADALARACPPVLDRAATLAGAVSNPAALPESLHVGRQLADVFHYGLVTAPPAHPKLPPLGFAPPPPERDPVPTPSTPRAGRARRGAAAAGSRAVSLVASAAASLLASFRRPSAPVTAPAPDGPFAAPSPIATASLVATEFTNAEGQLAVPEVAPSIPLQVATRAEPAAPSALGHVLHAHAVALSIARQRVRLFEGDMNVVSMENLGTDTYLHMRYDGAAAGAAGGSKREDK
ncbi:hypothetical protein AMAG_03258 [Allomyces macrogynus ATCC 38327]|uniref:Uncharacterized protein n=1 Tax=Allomyces macrogynus (strain ATCC 38327) TaxID=578462 RepID=A0A0L0S574_ALLM3|nr:hypothetical protein AMAG_03258 [Allomyces macrogynus ATCC 38327]|eukprot:KNE57561.1 hypothetical protein AMAG_03258 [Allomyces macrogynus ATCC 38327]